MHLRSVQRDLEQLSHGFRGLVCDTRSKPYAWSWDRDAPALQLSLMGLSAAVTLDLSRAHLQAALPRALLRALEPTFEEAERALALSQDARLSRWRQKVRALPRGYPRRAPRVSSRVVDAVYDALLEERVLDVQYTKRGARTAASYSVEPLALVLRDGVITLVCQLAGTEQLRHLLLHRMGQARVAERNFRFPVRFSLDKHIESGALGFLLGSRVSLHVRVDAGVAASLMESPLSSDQRVEAASEEGWCLLRASVSDSMELRGYLRSLGALVEVLEPLELREAMAAEARKLAACYGRTVLPSKC